MRGPYTICNRPVIVKEWHPNYDMKEDMLRTLPIWIKLPTLPLRLWGARSLNKIGSLIGVPLVTDECTAHKLRVSYARILVEVDITRKLIEEITIKDQDGRKVHQKIDYEWRPKFCEKCQKVGHQCGEEVLRKVWKPKSQSIHPEPDIAANTPKEDKIPVVLEQNWTVVNKAAKDKGKKKISYPETATSVQCVNGFGVLEVLNEPLVVTGSVT